MNVRADRQREFNAEVQERLSTTVWARADCFTYFKIENGKITTNWPGYRDRISLADAGGAAAGL